jgi:hypothetical protein
MTNRPAFGRRGAPLQTARMRAPALQSSPVATPVIAQSAISVSADASRGVSVEDELAEWRRTRRRMPIPWRPLNLMASVCFGLATFVLPASVNDIVQWPLYGLAAVSFYVGITSRRRAREGA